MGSELNETERIRVEAVDVLEVEVPLSDELEVYNSTTSYCDFVIAYFECLRLG